MTLKKILIFLLLIITSVLFLFFLTKSDVAIHYGCPQTEYINCMPGPGISQENQTYCSGYYSDWIAKNCDVEIVY